MNEVVNPIPPTVSHEGTLKIMLFVRPTRGHGGPYRVNRPCSITTIAKDPLILYAD